MRWPIFFVFLYLTLGLDLGLRGLWQVHGATPSLMLILVVYIGLSAPPLAVGWAAILAGILIDLGRIAPGDGMPLDVVGPAALGMFLAGYAAIQLRGLVLRQSAITLAVTVFFAGLMAHLLTVTLLAVRGWPISPATAVAGWSSAEQLLGRFLDLIYTCLVALPAAKLLFKTDPLWGFTQIPGHRGR
ncbi:MAG: hypothetical protein IT442_06615 [Phycisphaeraceae bacterium]|nr:hypothetical protein [Phycisphaeraceae bacterium]